MIIHLILIWIHIRVFKLLQIHLLRQLEDGPGYGLKLVAVIFEIFVVLTDSV
jgi:hypothetical protein